MLARSVFEGERARALLAGNAAHSLLALEQPITGAFALTLALLGHVVGWPFPRGGAQKIADALARHFRELGGEIVTGTRVTSLDELPRSRVVLCDLTPRGLLEIAGGRMPSAFRRKMAGYRWGFGAYKLDWALDGPIPWSAPGCLRAGTIHVGGSLDEIARSERIVRQGGMRSDRSCCWRSKPFSIAAVHRWVGTPHGHIATFRTARRSI